MSLESDDDEEFQLQDRRKSLTNTTNINKTLFPPSKSTKIPTKATSTSSTTKPLKRQNTKLFQEEEPNDDSDEDEQLLLGLANDSDDDDDL
jgi:hypothetical protein